MLSLLAGMLVARPYLCMAGSAFFSRIVQAQLFGWLFQQLMYTTEPLDSRAATPMKLLWSTYRRKSCTEGSTWHCHSPLHAACLLISNGVELAGVSNSMATRKWNNTCRQIQQATDDERSL